MDRMRVLMRSLLALALLLVSAVGYLAMFPVGQQPDRTFDARVASPAYPSHHPLALFDEGHYNAHSLSGGFAPFRELLRNDGYRVEATTERFSTRGLARADVLVIVNAAGGSNPKLFGFNLEPLRRGRRDAPAFRTAEVEAIRKWVAGGGSLLLVADHYPFGPAAASLAAAFGVTMHGGFAEVPKAYRGRQDSGSIDFSRANGLLADSPIANGRGTTERITEVLSFTGQSLDAPGAIALLDLPPTAIESVPPPPVFKDQPAGKSQGVALSYGRGRVVVLGEAGMLTAQVSEGHKFGMNVPGIDNRQFVLNTMHWLTGLF